MLYGRLPFDDLASPQRLFAQIQNAPISFDPLDLSHTVAAQTASAGSPELSPLSAWRSVTLPAREMASSENVSSTATTMSHRAESDDEDFANDAARSEARRRGASGGRRPTGSHTSSPLWRAASSTTSSSATPRNHVDRAWREILEGMLHRDPARRLTVRQIRRRVVELLLQAENGIECDVDNSATVSPVIKARRPTLQR
jgi:hypothetical protein